MLRGGRSSPSSQLLDTLRESPTNYRDFLLAVAPLPRGEAFRIAGWPRWLVPSEIQLSSTLSSKGSQKRDHR
ncbi:MAG: hypothetical protein ACLPZM_07840 [Thermoplasmata archaeon]